MNLDYWRCCTFDAGLFVYSHSKMFVEEAKNIYSFEFQIAANGNYDFTSSN
jgi:hypothetical protein